MNTTSAPCSKALVVTGGVAVQSAASRALPSWAISATDAMFVTSQVGFVIGSTQTKAVSPGRIFYRTASGRVMSTKSNPMLRFSEIRTSHSFSP